MNRRLLVASVLGLVLLAIPGAALALAASAKKSQPDLTVMSRNLYLGADIIQLASAPDLAAEKANAKTLHATVDKTNFALRAKALAREIATYRPDVIALQEVARYFRSADATPGQKATTPLYDWMKLLQKQLRARHQTYTDAAEQTEMDITVPSDDGYNLRLKLGNAVLVRGGSGAKVKVTGKLAGNFAAANQLHLTLKDGQAVQLTRGYAGIDGTIAGKKFRFLAPHAEAYSAAAAKGQFGELLAGAAKITSRPVIIAGDFNSDPNDPEPNAYKAVIAGGFVDTGKRVATCCQNEFLSNPASELKTWIDHIVVRPKAKVLSGKVFGNRPSDRIGGLWPSDHAGVTATIRLG